MFKKPKYWENMHPLNQAIRYKNWLKRRGMCTKMIDRRIKIIASGIDWDALLKISKNES